MASLRLGSLPRRGGSGSHRDGTFPRAGYRDRVPPSASLPPGKPTASSWKPPSLRIPGSHHGVPFHRGERDCPRGGEADRVVLEAAITADTEISSCCRLPRRAGSLPRREEADLATLDAPAAADTGTPCRCRLPSRRRKPPSPQGSGRPPVGPSHRGGYRNRVSWPPSALAREASPGPRRQIPSCGRDRAPQPPAQRPLPTPPALKGRQHRAWGVSPREPAPRPSPALKGRQQTGWRSRR
jgi:hypothetical protein